jgi:predicted MFS family arabinose efflux permease
MGPISDNFGKYRVVAISCAGASIAVALCGITYTLNTLLLARIASAAFAGWIIPMGMAYVGDVVPYEQRQQVLARYLSGQISGQLFGQAAGGILGDIFGWRGVFFVLAGFLAVAAIGLCYELFTNPATHQRDYSADRRRSFIAENKVVLKNPWARVILLAGFIEYSLMFGAFAYIGAFLHTRFDLSFTAIGLCICMFAVGGLIYAGFVKVFVARFGQIGLAGCGGVLIGLAYLALAGAQSWWQTPFATMFLGLGFYMLHNTLQTNATQMSPDARGTAVGLYSGALYIGQTVGVAAAAPLIDHSGAPPVFVIAGTALAATGIWVAFRIKRHKPLA